MCCWLTDYSEDLDWGAGQNTFASAAEEKSKSLGLYK